MRKSHAKGPLLLHLEDIEKLAQSQSEDVKLGQIFDIFGTEGHFFLILFLIIPFMQPIPLLGMSTPFGILIMTVALFAYFKKPPFLPQKWKGVGLSQNTVFKITRGLAAIFSKVSWLFHPRAGLLFSSAFQQLNFFVLLASAALLTLPLPIPFSNAIPAWVVFLQALAQLEKDGFLVVVSYIGFAICLLYFQALFWGASFGLESLMQFF